MITHCRGVAELIRTRRQREDSYGGLSSAHPVLGHALVDAVVLRAHVDEAEGVRGQVAVRGHAEGLGVMEPHHGGGGVTPNLTTEPDGVAPHGLLLQGLHLHLGRL